MSFERWVYYFEGGYLDFESLLESPGVYIIWCKSGNNWSVLDVGESENIKKIIANNDRRECWERNCIGYIYYSAHYMQHSTQNERKEIESDIRNSTGPLCDKV